MTQALLVCAGGALLWCAAAADRAWFLRHLEVPAWYLQMRPIVHPAVRLSCAALGLLLLVSVRRATPAAAGRVLLALALALVSAELIVRAAWRPALPAAGRLETRLSERDPRTGWHYVAKTITHDVSVPRSRGVDYAIDAQGDRAPSPEFAEDAAAPTLLFAGESVATGHGLEWNQTFAALLGVRFGLQVVNASVSGYASDQAYLRAHDALARLQRPVAVITTVLPVQLFRNVQDDRPHLVLRDGALLLAPEEPFHLRLRDLLVNKVPYLPEWRLRRSLALTRAILERSAEEARARGAAPLFVLPSFGPERALEAHPEAFVVHALLDGLPYLVVDIDLTHVLPYDGHPDAEGARQLAEAIAARLAPVVAKVVPPVAR